MKNKSKIIELTKDDIAKLKEKITSCNLPVPEQELIINIIESYKYINLELENKNTSIRKLKKIFNIQTEKKSNVIAEVNKEEAKNSIKPDKKKKKGHGRLKSSAYKDAEIKTINHTQLKSGDKCPLCHHGIIYDNIPPGIFVKFSGQPSFKATIIKREKLRCNICNAIFEAPLPEGMDNVKYDESASSMLVLLRYGMGFPMYRIEKMQNNLETPLPMGTQWQIIEEASDKVNPVYQALENLASEGELIHNDDTGVKILSLIEENKDLPDNERKGMFTTGIISMVGDKKIVLYFSGRNHAGENMEKILTKRSKNKAPPIQMCDGLARNLPKNIQTLLSNCLTHGRRNFVNCINDYPDECEYVIEQFGKIYKYDNYAKGFNFSSEERLSYHQENSKPIMLSLKEWLENKFDLKLVEPNSSLGKAIKYMLKHWDALTLFLKIPGVPLDNNILEQSLKKAILFRKNSLFYKNEFGALVGDMFMSIINTCIHAKVNPYNYLIFIQANYEKVKETPLNYLPWNYLLN